MRSRDTSIEAAEFQRRILREKTPEERLRIAIEMSDFARELTRVGIRRRHPDWSERRVHAEFLRRLHGPEVAQWFLDRS